MTDIQTELARLSRQEQFLDVVSSEEATARFHARLDLCPLGRETVTLAQALHRVLAESVSSDVDVPGFDRSSVDGFALSAADAEQASERAPRRLRLNPEILTPGVVPTASVGGGAASLIATGGMVPRGADAVVMVEHTQTIETNEGIFVEIVRPAATGQCIAWAGGDIARGETVLHAGALLTSREIGVLAAIGCASVQVYRKPRVAIISSGDEIVAPGEPIGPGAVYDSNAAILTAAVEETGGVPVSFGISPDDEAALSRLIAEGLASCDMVLMSGGTSKGAGDICYRAVDRYKDPGIVVHGVALKPGKPVCLAVTGGKPLIILPGFPTSAIFTFHEFVAPVIRALSGRRQEQAEEIKAVLPLRIASDRGRKEFLMVSLAPGPDGALAAYPIAKGSGSVTSFSHADGFVAIDPQVETLPAGAPVAVRIIGKDHRLADLVVIGSHCVGLDVIVGRLEAEGVSVKLLSVGSTGGLTAAKRGECDIAPVHLMDPATGEYNRPFLAPDLELISGYRRLQGIVFRRGDVRFEGRTPPDALAAALADRDCIMVNRNAGSGTRILMDRLLGGARPPGYWSQPKSHNAVAAAVVQGRADWGLAIETVAAQYGLGFIPVQEEHYDFIVPQARHQRACVRRFAMLLDDGDVRQRLRALKFSFEE
jgi:putative molybdopterin biosynthesis protein